MAIMNSIKKHPIVSIVVAIDVVLVIVVGVFGLIKGLKTATIDVLLAPLKAKVVINGKEYETGAYRVNPGKVTATIVADGFKEKKVELELQADKTTKIYEYLEPLEDNLNYYANKESELKRLEKLGNTDIVRVVSIKKYLPIIEFNYGGLNEASYELVITQDFDCDKIFCLRVTGDNSESHEYTKIILRQKGYNPDDYQIKYQTR